jgi:hypothetical protein
VLKATDYGLAGPPESITSFVQFSQFDNHCCPVNLDHKRKSAQIQVKGTVLRLAE